MRIINLSKAKGEPRCPKCNVPIDFDVNYFYEKNDPIDYGVDKSKANGWFECPKCRGRWLVEGYDE